MSGQASPLFPAPASMRPAGRGRTIVLCLALAWTLGGGSLAWAQSTPPAATPAPQPNPTQSSTSSPNVPPSGARTPHACPAPDAYLTPKVPLRRAAEALRNGKQLRVLVFSSTRNPSIPESVEAKRYPTALTQALMARYPGQVVSVTAHIEPQASIGENLKALKAQLAEKPFDLVVWQLGSTDVLRGTDLSLYGAKLANGVSEIQARRADAILVTMQYSPRTDFMFDAGPYMQYLRWVARSEGAALFNRYDVMRYWVEDGSFDLSELQPGASIFEDVHRCVGLLLARFIANGIAASESQ